MSSPIPDPLKAMEHFLSIHGRDHLIALMLQADLRQLADVHLIIRKKDSFLGTHREAPFVFGLDTF